MRNRGRRERKGNTSKGIIERFRQKVVVKGRSPIVEGLGPKKTMQQAMEWANKRFVLCISRGKQGRMLRK